MTTRIFIAGFKHETNTFSTLPTDIAAYRARALHFDDEIVPTYTGTNTEIGGFLAASERNGWTPIPGVVADATPSVKVTTEADQCGDMHAGRCRRVNRIGHRWQVRAGTG